MDTPKFVRIGAGRFGRIMRATVALLLVSTSLAFAPGVAGAIELDDGDDGVITVQVPDLSLIHI